MSDITPDEKLSDKHCIPCEGGVAPLSRDESSRLLARLRQAWSVSDTGKKIRCEFTFKDFTEAMFFVSKVANVAQMENHHPDIFISYNRVVIEIWTHAIGGLSENDFILAAKVEESLS